MKSNYLAALALVGITATATSALADPCGMVPPIQIIERNAITRIGVQKTYVSFYKGIETVVLRPGFKGKVDEFGMLIPFPSAPAIRKVDDNIFSHIASAIDPPEVAAWVQRRRPLRGRAGMARGAPMTESAKKDEKDLEYDTVRVVKREAVGMYDVAVLEAGSARALQRWMDNHGFRYPTGMDKVTQEYVDSGWVFVAVKTKVGRKDGVNPRPGMRKTDSKLPTGASFSGHVQAMGFRFRTDKLVVPMRLSAFNPGELRNAVYILTDGPRRINNIPKRYVKRQVSGTEIFHNVTKPLPLRVYGGTYNQLTKWQKQNLKTQRNPEPHNSKAKELFASDLLAITSGRLANPVEEKEKSLLAIGERLGLRGVEIDRLHDQELKKQRDVAVKRSLRRLKQLTMTVVDGDFDRDVLARENLTFAYHRMPNRRNNRFNYDSRQLGPVGNPGGKLYRSAKLDQAETAPTRGVFSEQEIDEARDSAWPGLGATSVGLGFVVILGFAWRRRRLSLPWLAIFLGLSISALAATAGGQLAFASGQYDEAAIERLIAKLSNAKQAQATVDKLVRIGKSAVDPLVDEIVDGNDNIRKGWAIVALAEIGGDKAVRELIKLHSDGRQPMLIRTWAMAARINAAKTPEKLLQLVPVASGFQGMQRPLAVRMRELMSDLKGPQAVEAMLSVSARMPAMQNELRASIVAAGSENLTKVMFTAKDQNARRMAASYLGGMVNQPGSDVAKHVVAALAFRSDVQQVPWHGGALFLPGINWSKSNGRALVDNLMRWNLWMELNGQAGQQRQIYNNLTSVGLTRVVGYQPPGWNQINAVSWLTSWKRVVGRAGIKAILKQQGVHKKSPYRDLLKR